MSELEKINREGILKGVASKLTYETSGSANVTIANTATPPSVATTKTMVPASTKVVQPTVHVVSTEAGQSGQEKNMTTIFRLN
jgi:hypothetical protein